MLTQEKTQVCTFHLKSHRANQIIDIKWVNKKLEATKHPVYLGVTPDRTLSFQEHISKLRKKNLQARQFHPKNNSASAELLNHNNSCRITTGNLKATPFYRSLQTLWHRPTKHPQTDWLKNGETQATHWWATKATWTSRSSLQTPAQSVRYRLQNRQTMVHQMKPSAKEHLPSGTSFAKDWVTLMQASKQASTKVGKTAVNLYRWEYATANTPQWGVRWNFWNMLLFPVFVLIKISTVAIHFCHRAFQGSIYYYQSHLASKWMGYCG